MSDYREYIEFYKLFGFCAMIGTCLYWFMVLGRMFTEWSYNLGYGLYHKVPVLLLVLVCTVLLLTIYAYEEKK